MAKPGQITASPDLWLSTPSLSCDPTTTVLLSANLTFWDRTCYHAHISDELRLENLHNLPQISWVVEVELELKAECG